MENSCGGPEDGYDCTFHPAFIFRLDSEADFEVLRSYGSEDPLSVAGASTRLVSGWDGAFYYPIAYWGPGSGAIVRVGSDGGSTIVHTFSTSHGAPGMGSYGDLVLGSDCALNGTTQYGDPEVAASSITASGSCTVGGDQVTLSGVGLCTLTASQAGDADYEPAASPGASALHSARSNGRDTFRWKTRKDWADSCRELALELADSSAHPAYFSFKRKHARTHGDEDDEEDRDRDRDEDDD